MIIGVGTDIIEIERIKKAIDSSIFIQRLFTDEELKYLNTKKAESFAGYFAAKEAVSKALGTGISGFSFKDIEILKKGGVPYVVLHGGARKVADGIGIKEIKLSISHCREYAVAFAVAEG